jgi:hypothetical protein
MKKLLNSIRIIQRTFDESGYICKNYDGKPFFGEIRIVCQDGRIIFKRNKDEEVTETLKV